MSNSRLKKLKSGIKNGTEVTLNLSSNFIGNSNYKTHLPRTLLLTNRQFLRPRKAFSNNSSANIKLVETQRFELGQSGGFLGGLLEPLLKVF